MGALVHMRSEIVIANGYGIGLALVNKSPKRAVFFQCKASRQCVLGSRRFDDFQLETLGDFILLKLQTPGLWVQLGMERSGMVAYAQAIPRFFVVLPNSGPRWPSTMDSNSSNVVVILG